MEELNYLIINPLQIELLNKKANVENMSEIEEKFHKKILWLKNINDNLKQIKIQRWLVDV